MRLALFIIAVLVLIAAAWLGFAAMAPRDEGTVATDSSLPVFMGEEGEEDVNEDAFGPGPTICSMDPRYRPNAGAEQTCPVVQ